MYFAEVFRINSLVQLNEFHGCTNTYGGPFVIQHVEQVSAQSSCSVVSGNIAATVLADELFHSKLIFLNAVGHDFLTPP